MDALTGWAFLTRWGNSMLLLPVASCIAIGLWAAGDRRIAWRWASCFGGAVLLVLATKVAFLGWGLGIRALDFTGISGHSALAASVLPTLGWWLTQERTRETQRNAALAGFIVAAGIAVSRVLLTAHSISEAAAGLVVGALVAWLVIPRGVVADARSRYRWALLCALLLAGLLPSVSESENAHGLVVQIALQLSGRSQPFDRSNY